MVAEPADMAARLADSGKTVDQRRMLRIDPESGARALVSAQEVEAYRTAEGDRAHKKFLFCCPGCGPGTVYHHHKTGERAHPSEDGVLEVATHWALAPESKHSNMSCPDFSENFKHRGVQKTLEPVIPPREVWSVLTKAQGDTQGARHPSVIGERFGDTSSAVFTQRRKIETLRDLQACIAEKGGDLSDPAFDNIHVSYRGHSLPIREAVFKADETQRFIDAVTKPGMREKTRLYLEVDMLPATMRSYREGEEIEGAESRVEFAGAVRTFRPVVKISDAGLIRGLQEGMYMNGARIMVPFDVPAYLPAQDLAEQARKLDRAAKKSDQALTLNFAVHSGNDYAAVPRNEAQTSQRPIPTRAQQTLFGDDYTNG